MSPSSSRPRTAAFHAVNRGSNPLGDAKKIQGLRVKSKSFFRMWGIVAPHSAALRQKQGQRNFGSTSKTGAKEFWGIHSDEVFFSLSAEHADTQAVVFKIPEAVRSSLDQFHFPMEAFGYPVVLREAEHPGDLLLPLHLQNA